MDEKEHPLLTKRIVGAFSLLALSLGVGMALMSFHLLWQGLAICLLGVAGVLWIYGDELLRLRLRIVGDGGGQSSLTRELWVVVTSLVIAVIAPGSIIYYELHSSVGTHETFQEIRHLRPEAKERMRKDLTLGPNETYELQVNSMPGCDECEQFAEELRIFLNTIPGWKAGGSVLIFPQPPRRGLWLVANESDQHLWPVDLLFKAFENGGVPLRRSSEGVMPKTFVILIARQGVL